MVFETILTPKVTEGVSGQYPTFFRLLPDHLDSFDRDYGALNITNPALILSGNPKQLQNRFLLEFEVPKSQMVFPNDAPRFFRCPSVMWAH